MRDVGKERQMRDVEKDARRGGKVISRTRDRGLMALRAVKMVCPRARGLRLPQPRVAGLAILLVGDDCGLPGVRLLPDLRAAELGVGKGEKAGMP